RRYGVVFRGLIGREADWLPPWRLILRSLRRLEARGEIRGGRFVAGVYGEQYALAEAVEGLRRTRKQPRNGRLVSISAADPLNLVGVVDSQPKVPALTDNRILFRDGVPVAKRVAGKTEPIGDHSGLAAWDVERALLGLPESAEAAWS
ncbi:MAG: hypothetical protein R3236_09675, partial [Phycisphaeraceae bacterium]|nr:hypothetical protein [Phycisphaeraceae bacterium]